MGGAEVQNETARRQRRRWHFAAAIFDECAWTLTVAGQLVPLERKPLELLRALLERAGEVVSKDELLEAAWPGVVVVEASLPTAIRKLRRALGDEDSARPIIATVARIGYRLTVPVRAELADCSAQLMQPTKPAPPRQQGAAPSAKPWRLLAVTGAALLTIGLVSGVQFGTDKRVEGVAAPASTAAQMREARLAIRQMDAAKLQSLIAVGWDPETPFDKEANGALNMLLERCEWDPGHDRQQMLMAARILIDGGAVLTRRNYWGDTAYSIAKSPRYCGGDHPVTVMLRRLCTSSDRLVLADCEADYATAKQRRAAEIAARIAS